MIVFCVCVCWRLRLVCYSTMIGVQTYLKHWLGHWGQQRSAKLWHTRASYSYKECMITSKLSSNPPHHLQLTHLQTSKRMWYFAYIRIPMSWTDLEGNCIPCCMYCLLSRLVELFPKFVLAKVSYGPVFLNHVKQGRVSCIDTVSPAFNCRFRQFQSLIL